MLIYQIHCPNCGSLATRNFFTSNLSMHLKCPQGQVTQTECLACDYLMVMCSVNARVVEAHAPGLPRSAGALADRTPGDAGQPASLALPPAAWPVKDAEYVSVGALFPEEATSARPSLTQGRSR